MPGHEVINAMAERNKRRRPTEGERGREGERKKEVEGAIHRLGFMYSLQTCQDTRKVENRR